MNKPELYTIREAMELLGKISRNSIYSLLRDGRLASLKIRRRRFIPPHAIKNFVDAFTNTDGCRSEKTAAADPFIDCKGASGRGVGPLAAALMRPLDTHRHARSRSSARSEVSVLMATYVD